MHFNVAQLIREPEGATRTYFIQNMLEAPGDGQDWHIEGHVELMKTDRGVWVSASFDSTALSTCSRCVEEYNQPIESHLDEEFFPVWTADSDVARSSPDGYGTTNRIDENNVLDLTEAILDYLALSVPLKPVCSDRCNGICPRCGTNLNQSTCRCDFSFNDVRWEPLFQLAESDRRTESLNN